MVFPFVNNAINFRAFLCVRILPESCTDGTNKSTILSYFSISNKHKDIISLSLVKPNARKTINKGTGDRTFGILTTILSNVYLFVGAIIFTDNVRIGFDTFSDTDRISAEYKYLSSLDFLIYSMLSPNFS